MKIDIKNVTKKYGRKTALKDFSIRLEPGIYGLMGANGAGKSTLMNILTGNLKMNSGQIIMDGINIREDMEKWLGRLGYLPQEQICYPQFSLQEFLEYMAILKKQDINKREVQEQLNQLMHYVNLYDVRKQKLGSFSGGMKRRAILAQALIGNPDFIILDEPTAGLDPKERIAMRNMIAELGKDRIVLLATHIATDIESIADRVLVIRDGKLVAADKPDKLIENVAGHVRVIPYRKESFKEIISEYPVYNMIQSGEGLVINALTRECQEETEGKQVSLEEVFLYYCELDD